MDILSWTQFNPKIEFSHTTKKFFGKFLYKLIVYCPAGRVIDSKRDVHSELIHRATMAKNIGSWWGERMGKDLNNAHEPLLNCMKLLRCQHIPNTRMRIEEPYIQIYAESEKILIKIVEDYFKGLTDYIKSITGPANDEQAEILNSGAILRKKNIGYTHKVLIKDGKYDVATKDSILNYLNNLGTDIIKLPESGVHMLNKPSSYIWNLYFYTNDPSILTFLNIMHPGLISNIHELVSLL